MFNIAFLTVLLNLFFAKTYFLITFEDFCYFSYVIQPHKMVCNFLISFFVNDIFIFFWEVLILRFKFQINLLLSSDFFQVFSVEFSIFLSADLISLTLFISFFSSNSSFAFLTSSFALLKVWLQKVIPFGKRFRWNYWRFSSKVSRNASSCLLI